MRRQLNNQFYSLAVLAAILVMLPGCRKSSPPIVDNAPGDISAPMDLAGFAVRDDDAELVFQYFVDAAVRTAQSVADIPEHARTNVVVLSKAFRKGDLPADQVILANLTAPQEDGSYPYRLVSRYQGELPTVPAKRSSPTPKAAAADDNDVLLFTTEWCPHCRTARQWLTTNDIAYQQYDVEKDANARALLQKMGGEQGIPDHMLTSVPILAVKGKLILGFNEAEIRKLLNQ